MPSPNEVETAVLVLDVLIRLFLVIVGIEVTVIVFKLPGHMRRQEQRLQKIVDAVGENAASGEDTAKRAVRSLADHIDRRLAARAG